MKKPIFALLCVFTSLMLQSNAPSFGCPCCPVQPKPPVKVVNL